MKKNEESQNQKFFNTVLHDLRIPISSINGYASLFITGELGKVSKAQLKIIKKVRDLSLYTTELLNNFLSLACLNTRRRVHYERIFMPDLVKRAVTALNVQIRRGNSKIHSKFSKNIKPLWGFPIDIEQVVINILSNAIKFTSKNGHIYVSLTQGLDCLRLVIKDNGIGIPDEAVSRIFEDFYRADNTVSQYEGSGLGLSIVDRLLKHNRGTIAIKSKVNKGTSVEICLPMLTDKEVFDYELEQLIQESLDSKISFGLLLARERHAVRKTSRQNLVLKLLGGAVRGGDRTYQLIDGECLAILAGANYAEVRLISERLKSILQRKVILTKNKSKPSSNLAVAFAVFPADGANKEELLSFLQREINKPSALVVYVQ
jgi:light-regulated signal transduction histidine kinase (bacteriophytochrome)